MTGVLLENEHGQCHVNGPEHEHEGGHGRGLSYYTNTVQYRSIRNILI